MVSVITPSYNSAQFIAKCIESVIAQTYTQWEMIIIDDCSNDGSIEIIETYIASDYRIKLIKLSQNSGPAIARNRGIKEARGRYIAFLDSDDLWLPRKIEDQIKFMQHHAITLSYCSYDLIDKNGHYLKSVEPPDTLTYRELLKENMIGCLTGIYDTSEIGKIYMPVISKRQDYGLWLKILKKVPKAHRTPGNLAQYRVLDNSVSSNKSQLLKFNYLLFRDIEGFSMLKSVYYVGWNVVRKIMKK